MTFQKHQLEGINDVRPLYDWFDPDPGEQVGGNNIGNRKL